MLTIEPDRVLRVHRYTDMNRVRPVIRKAAERAADRANAIASPRAAFLRRRILSCGEGALSLEGGASFTCAAFDRLLGPCTEVAVFVLTIGARFEEEVADLIVRDEPVDALFLESAGWLLVERATRQFGGHLRDMLSPEGLGVTFRLGPGYDYRHGDERVRWGLDQQAALFGVFEGAEMPVTLLDSSAMLPKMSRSGLFGIAPRA